MPQFASVSLVMLITLTLSPLQATFVYAEEIDQAGGDQALVNEEVSAGERTQQELESRIEALEQQHQASQAIAEKQQQLIQALQYQIKQQQKQSQTPLQTEQQTQQP